MGPPQLFNSTIKTLNIIEGNEINIPLEFKEDR